MRHHTALSIYKREESKRCLSFGCRSIDERIGGILSGRITEISGEAGSGKSQLCMALALQCQLPSTFGGWDGKCAYMSCGEGEFPIQRLVQLADGHEERYGINKRCLLEGVLIETCHNPDDMLDSIVNKLPKICRENKIKLVIIDSLAGVIRSEYNTFLKSDMMDRTQMLFKIAQRLKALAATFDMGIIVVNQVTAAGFEDSGQHRDSAEVLVAGRVMDSIPALGLAWSHCVNVRISICRDHREARMPSFLEEDNDIDSTLPEISPQNSYSDLDFMEEGSPPLISAEVAHRQAPRSPCHLEHPRFTHLENQEQNYSYTDQLTEINAVTKNSAERCDLTQKTMPPARVIALRFSPCSRQSDCVFYITRTGIVARED